MFFMKVEMNTTGLVLMKYILPGLGCRPGATTANHRRVFSWLIGSFPENKTNQPTNPATSLICNLCYLFVSVVTLTCDKLTHILSMVYKIPAI